LARVMTDEEQTLAMEACVVGYRTLLWGPLPEVFGLAFRRLICFIGCTANLISLCRFENTKFSGRTACARIQTRTHSAVLESVIDFDLRRLRYVLFQLSSHSSVI